MNGQWNTVYLPEICEIKTGKHDANHAVNNGKYRFYTCSSEFSMCDTTSFSGESVIVPGNGDIGLVFYYNGDFDAYQRTYVLNNIKINAKFLYYHMLHNWRSRNENKQFGSTIRYVRMSNFTNYTISFPASYEQQRIVDKIEDLFSKLDKGVEELNKIKEQLKIYRQAVLKEAFESDMECKPLGDISSSRLGKMLDKNKNRGEYRPYLRNINVRWMNFDLCELLDMKIEESELEKYTVKKGDLLVCEGGEPGRCAVWNMDYDICYQKAIHRIRFNMDTNPKFYMYYFYYMAQIGELSKYFTGMGIKHLTGESLKKVPVPILEMDAQQSILKCIEQKLSVCDKIEQTVNESLQKAESLRQSILKQAFEGKLV